MQNHSFLRERKKKVLTKTFQAEGRCKGKMNRCVKGGVGGREWKENKREWEIAKKERGSESMGPRTEPFSPREDYRQLFGCHPDTWRSYQVAVSEAFRGLWKGIQSSAVTSILRLFFTCDDGTLLKQVMLTEQQPRPLSLNLLQGNVTEWKENPFISARPAPGAALTRIRERSSMLSPWNICKHVDAEMLTPSSMLDLKCQSMRVL